MTSTIASLVNNQLNQYLSQGLLTGPAGPSGASGLTPGFSGPNGMVQNGNGQTTSVIGGTPIVSYIPASQGNGNYTGGSLAGFNNLSAGTFASGNTTISGNLNVSGPVSASSLTSSGDATIAGALSAATSTLSTLTVSGPATFNGSTTIAGLTVIGLNPGLTQGSIAFQGASGLSQDNANLFYDAANHRLGLGTTTPAFALDVNGTVNATALYVDGNPYVGSQWTTSGSNIYYTSGNVGIGTTTPTQKLDVAGNINISAGSAYMYNGANVITASTTLFNYFFGGEGNFTITGGQNTANGYQSLLSNTTGNNNAANGAFALLSNTTGVRNTANGMNALENNTTGAFNTANGSNALFDLNITNGTGNNTAIGYNAGRGIVTGVNNTILGANITGLAAGLSNNIIIADGAGNRRINVDSSGNVGIGTSSPSASLSVQGTNTNAVLGSELLTTAADRNFSSNSGDWSGTNWTIGGGVATHTAGANAFTNTLTAIAGATYQIVFTATTTATGTLTVSFGGVSGLAVGQSVGTITAETQVITTAGTGRLTFTPDANWTGTITNLSVKQITFSSAAQNILNSDGTLALEIRGGGSGGFGAGVNGDPGGGGDNVFIGTGVGRANTTIASPSNAGANNTAVGYMAFSSNTTGFANNVFGQQALIPNTTGANNDAFGLQSLYSNTRGTNNSGFGNYALGRASCRERV